VTLLHLLQSALQLLATMIITTTLTTKTEAIAAEKVNALLSLLDQEGGLLFTLMAKSVQHQLALSRRSTRQLPTLKVVTTSRRLMQ
jgi:hypothetical protein